MATIHSFTDLDCWKKATELRREISRIVNRFPATEKFALVSQITRAARSVTNNIAEGFGRYHYQEFIQFCRISRGSLTELHDHLIIAKDEKYISDQEFEDLRATLEKTTILINAFIKSLASRIARSKSAVEEPIVAYSKLPDLGPWDLTDNLGFGE